MEFIKNLISSDNLITIYMGFLGVIFSIVIFIATVVNDKKIIIEKRTIIYKTYLKEYIIETILIVIYAILVNQINYEKSNINVYYITHIVLFGFIMGSLIQTLITFSNCLKIILKEDYFKKCVEEYVYRRIEIINKRANQKLNKEFKKEKKAFEQFLKSQSFYTYAKERINTNNYVSICSNLSGKVRGLNVAKLDKLKNDYLTKKIMDNDDNNLSINKIFIVDCIGKKIRKGEPIFYCEKKQVDIFKELVNSIEYENNRFFLDDEIALINNDMAEYALEFNQPSNFDDNNQLYNYFKYLYDKELDGIRYSAIEKLYNICKLVEGDNYKNPSYCEFLNSIATMAYSNDKFAEYRKVIEFEQRLYYMQLQMNNDTKKVSYNFINSIFKFQFYTIKNENKYDYYDFLLSILLNFLIHLMKDDKVEEINVIINNIYMDYYQNSDNDMNSIDKYNFQFCYGIVSALTLLSNEGKIRDVSKLQNLIEFVKRMTANLYNAWDAIQIYKDLKKDNSFINEVVSHIELWIIDHEYQSSWSINTLSDMEVLKNILVILELSYSNLNENAKQNVNKDDQHYYKNLLNMVNEKTSFEKLYSVEFKTEDIIRDINEVIKFSEEKEREYNRTNRIDKNKKDDFEKKLIDSLSNLHLSKELRRFKKVSNSREHKPVVYGINQLIPRDLFFTEVYGSDQYLEELTRVFNNGVEKDFLKKMDQISIVIEEKLEDFIKKLKEIEDYIFISNNTYIYSHRFLFNEKDKTIIFDDKKLACMVLKDAKNAYLIKKEELPALQFCLFNSDFENKFIHNSVFYELIDCSQNELIRKEIIENSSWIKEKGSIDEQDNYLREKLRLRAYISYKIVRISGAKAYKFI